MRNQIARESSMPASSRPGAPACCRLPLAIARGAGGTPALPGAVLISGLAVAVLAVFLALAPDALAQVPGATGDGFVWRDYQEPAAPAQQPLWLQAFWFVVKLVAVLGLAYASLLVYKRMLGTRAPLGFGRIRVLESTRLAGTQSLYLVQVGEQIMLLGSNGAGVLVKLSEWPADQPPPPQDQAVFGRTIARAAGRGDDFDTVIESSLQQAVIPPRDNG